MPTDGEHRIPNQEKIVEFTSLSSQLDTDLRTADTIQQQVQAELVRLKEGKGSREMLATSKNNLEKLRIELDKGMTALHEFSFGDSNFFGESQKYVLKVQKMIEELEDIEQEIEAALAVPSATPAPESTSKLSEQEQTMARIREQLDRSIGNDDAREALGNSTHPRFVLETVDDVKKLKKAIDIIRHTDQYQMRVAAFAEAEKMIMALPPSQDKADLEEEHKRIGELRAWAERIDGPVSEFQQDLIKYEQSSRLLEEAEKAKDDEKKEDAKTRLSELKQKIWQQTIPAVDRLGVVIDLAALHPDLVKTEKGKSVYPWTANLKKLESAASETGAVAEWSDIPDRRCDSNGIRDTLKKLSEAHFKHKSIGNDIKFAAAALTATALRLEDDANPFMYMGLYDRKRYTAAIDALTRAEAPAAEERRPPAEPAEPKVRILSAEEWKRVDEVEAKIATDESLLSTPLGQWQPDYGKLLVRMKTKERGFVFDPNPISFIPSGNARELGAPDLRRGVDTGTAFNRIFEYNALHPRLYEIQVECAKGAKGFDAEKGDVKVTVTGPGKGGRLPVFEEKSFFNVGSAGLRSAIEIALGAIQAHYQDKISRWQKREWLRAAEARQIESEERFEFEKQLDSRISKERITLGSSKENPGPIEKKITAIREVAQFLGEPLAPQTDEEAGEQLLRQLYEKKDSAWLTYGQSLIDSGVITYDRAKEIWDEEL